MGNLDFLEKKPRIAYTLSWDGITEGKITNTQAMRKVYKISSEEFIPRPDIIWTPTGSSGRPCNTPENIRLGKNYRFRNIEDVSNVSVSVLKEDTNTAGYYKFDLFFGDDNTYADLFYVLVANKEIISGDFGNVNPIFPETGWYFSGDSNTEVGDIMSVLKDPLIIFSYSGKGFTSPQKPYRYSTRSFDSDDVISIFCNKNMIPRTEEDKSKGFNAICIPGDWDTKADIKLNKDLADIAKAGYVGCLNIYMHINDLTDGLLIDNSPSFFRGVLEIAYNKINNVYGLSIYINNSYDMIDHIYFNPNITREEYEIWLNKYFSNTP